MTPLDALLPTLQIAIGPVILISGIGLLLLSMTNRLGRTVDRTRDLARECRTLTGSDRDRLVGQLAILMRRARIMRAAIGNASLSVLCAAALIIVLFVGALLQLSVTALLVEALFVVCLTAVIAALGFFIWDINLSLRALRVELDAVGVPRH
jgi:hypothetical protein